MHNAKTVPANISHIFSKNPSHLVTVTPKFSQAVVQPSGP